MTVQKLKGLLLFPFEVAYQPFRSFIKQEVFNYLSCGAINQAVYLLIYHVSYRYITGKGRGQLLLHGVTPHIAAYAVALSVCLPLGFILSKYIVFPGSYLRTRRQLFRHLLLTALFISLTCILLKYFVERCGFNATFSCAFINVLLTVLGFLSQKYFTFRKGSQKQVE